MDTTKDYVKFFVQEMVPAVDFDGNLLMKSEDSLAMSPNGNGGWFKSLINAGLDKDLKDKGVEWLNVFCCGQCASADCRSCICRVLQSSPAVSAALRWSEMRSI